MVKACKAFFLAQHNKTQKIKFRKNTNKKGDYMNIKLTDGRRKILEGIRSEAQK